MGSSKGGTAAIYYGLQCDAKAVYAGACQYYIGDYLSRPQFAPIVEGMAGREPTEEVIASLNDIMPRQLKDHAGSKTVIHLLFSKGEHTYKEHTVGLIKDLKYNNIPFREIERSFPNHDDVGKFFSPYIQKELEIELSKK